MARPRLYDEPRIGLALRLPKTIRDELQRAADARDVSVNFLATKAIGEYLQGHPTVTLDFKTSHGESVAS
jgi:predicted HicB family RNase H-like nuclease